MLFIKDCHDYSKALNGNPAFFANFFSRTELEIILLSSVLGAWENLLFGFYFVTKGLYWVSETY